MKASVRFLRTAVGTAVISLFLGDSALRAAEAVHAAPAAAPAVVPQKAPPTVPAAKPAATPASTAAAPAHPVVTSAPAPKQVATPAPAPTPHPQPVPAASPAPAVAAVAAPANATHHVEAETEMTPELALQRLIDGNRRFADGHGEHPNQSIARRIEVAGGQHPFAVVVTCSDSRVGPEIYFDQGLGDLFVVRDAGNVMNEHVIGSIEYAVEHLHASVVLVVGHSKCGAVAATIAGGRPDGHIRSIVDSIRPAVKETRNQAGDKLDNAVRANARLGARSLAANSPLLAHAVQSGEIRIFSAHYDLASGRVDLIP